MVEGHDVAPDEIISIASGAPHRQRLMTELSQPTYSINAVGKVVIDKAPEGAKSPNLADSVMINFATAKRAPMRISDDALSYL